MPAYRLLALDIDGTLVNSQNELTPATRDAVVRALEAGVEVVLATGRRYSRTLPLVEPLGIKLPLVTASGALIKHPADHRTLFRAEFGGSSLPDLLKVVYGAGYEAILYGDTFADGFDFFCRSTETTQPEMMDFLSRNPESHRLWPTLSDEPPAGVFAGFAIGNREEMLALHERLQAELPGQLYTHVLRSPRYMGHMCEIAPVGVTKWSGILHLAEQSGIAPHEICAVGDDVNDIPMVVESGLGIAMENAVPELKAVADLIAPDHDADGLVQVVEWVLNGPPSLRQHPT